MKHSRRNCVCGNEWPLLIDTVGVEIKCIYPSDNNPPVRYSCPMYYVMQVLAEMVVLNCMRLLLCFYSEISMVVVECEFDGKPMARYLG